MIRTRWVSPIPWAAALLLAVPLPGAALEFSGTSRTTFRTAWADTDRAGDDRGNYLSEHLSAEASGLPLDTGLFLSGSYKWDLGDEGPDSPFYSSVDRFSGGRHLFVYEAGLTARPLAALELTAGRFTWESAESVHLDGGALEIGLPEVPVSLSAFGGRVVQFYRDLEKDELYGAGLDARLPWAVRAEVRYMDYFDDLTRITLRKSFGEELSAKAGAEWVNSDLREATLSATAWLEETGTEVTATFYKKVGDRNDADYLLDYTSDADPGRYELERLELERQAPYHQYSFSLEQTLGPAVTLSASYTKRDLLDEDTFESASNTSFDVVQAGLGLREPGIEGLRLDGRVSWWLEDRVEGPETRSTSWAVWAEQEVGRGFCLNASWYWKEEDVNNAFENAVARSLGLGVAYRPSRAWDLSLDYTRETDDLLAEVYGVDEVHTLETRLTVRF